MQHLLVFQSLWAMENLRSGVGHGSLEERIRLIIEAKFDGISSGWSSREAAKAIWEATRGTGLQIEGVCFPHSVDDLKRMLEIAAEFPVRHLSLQADVRPRTLDACAPILEGWLRVMEQADVPIYLETHRDQMTNDLFVTLELLQRYPELQLLADIAHYVIARGFAYPVSDENHQAMHEILDRAWAYHGRVASGERVQLELACPSNQPWVDQFADWWTYGFRSWQRRAPPEATLVFTCELLPQPYALAGSDGRDLTDRWHEALQLRNLARQSWHNALAT